MSAQRGHVHPTEDDPVATALSEGIGGPMGRHAGGHRWWTPTRVVLLLAAVCFALGMVQKSGGNERHWVYDEHQYTHMSYSDLPFLYYMRGLAELDYPYSDDAAVRARYEPMEYPVGISYFAYGAAWVTHVVAGSPDVSDRKRVPADQVVNQPGVLRELRGFMIVNGVLFALLAIISAGLLSGVNRRRPWDALGFAASPLLALTGLINWDLLAVVMVAGALWTWSRDKPIATGILIGLGTAAKLYPLFLLGPVAIICIRERRWRELASTAGWALVAWLVLNVPAYLSSVTAWDRFWSFNSERGPDLGSIWLVLAQASGSVITPHTVNVWSWGFFLVWCLLVALVGFRAPSTPRLAQLGFLVVTGFLLINKVYSPQYVLWLLPLAVLARPRWRDQLIWQACELVYFCSVWWYLDSALAPGGGTDASFYWIAIVIRMLGELYLVAVVTRDVLRPRHDVVSELNVDRVLRRRELVRSGAEPAPLS